MIEKFAIVCGEAASELLESVSHEQPYSSSAPVILKFAQGPNCELKRTSNWDTSFASLRGFNGGI